MMRPCDACGQPFAVRKRDHRFCSAPCRLAAWQAGQDRQRQERDARVRLLLTTAREAIEEAWGLLKDAP